MLSPEVIQKISDGKSDANGRYCDFFRLNDKVGLKLYFSKEMRDRAMQLQSQAEKLGLGPEVYGEFSIDVEMMGRNHKLYGYYTEIVDILQDVIKERKRSRYIKFRFGEFLDRLQYITRRKLRPILNFHDSQLFNIGVKNGRLICIDFGE